MIARTVVTLRSVPSSVANALGHSVSIGGASRPISVTQVNTSPQGPAGAAAPGFIKLPAAITLSGHRAVYRATDGLRYASSDDLAAVDVVGVTTSSASAGSLASVQADGVITEPSWAWQLGPVWLGVGGLLTQAAPLVGAAVEIGIATSPTSLLVRPQPVIVLL